MVNAGDVILGDEILRIIDEHSGGMKYLELIAELSGAVPWGFVNEDVMQAIDAHPELDIFKYTCKMCNNLFREKMFVYRK